MAPRNTFAATRRSHTILKWLKNGRDVRIDDVSDEFGIEYAQARADLKLLEKEYNLQTGRDGRIKVWRWSEFDPEHINVATAASLELGAIAIDLFKDTMYGESIDDFADYCREQLPAEQRGDVDRLSRSLHLRRTWLPTDRGQVEHYLESVLDSLNKHWLIGRYQTADGDRGDYLMFPRQLIWYHGRLWLLAHNEDELKLFDLAGFEDLEISYAWEESADLREQFASFLEEFGPLAGVDDVTSSLEDAAEDEATDNGENDGGAEADAVAEFQSEAELDAAIRRRWIPSEPGEIVDGEDADPSEYFDNSFGIYAQTHPTRDIHLEVSGSWKSYFERYRMHPTQENTQSEEGDTLHVKFRMDVCPEFKSFVLGMIPEVTVHEPDELREELRERVQDWIGDEETDQAGT